LVRHRPVRQVPQAVKPPHRLAAALPELHPVPEVAGQVPVA
jgi:hypothetical protein